MSFLVFEEVNLSVPDLNKFKSVARMIFIFNRLNFLSKRFSIHIYKYNIYI